MTLRFDNPFHDLWVTEILDPTAYVRMFSPVLVRDAEALFSTGNIVVKGRQGSGKSMLLSLLDTSTRIAYAKQQSTRRSDVEPYPVPSKQRQFISAGVQLSRQNAALIAARAGEYPDQRRNQIVASNFADYLNSLLCFDLLTSIISLREVQFGCPGLVAEVPVNISTKSEIKFFEELHAAETWSGCIPESCTTIRELLAGR